MKSPFFRIHLPKTHISTEVHGIQKVKVDSYNKNVGTPVLAEPCAVFFFLTLRAVQLFYCFENGRKLDLRTLSQIFSLACLKFI